LPFGEDWVDQHNSSWNAPYTFSGKEKDAETGYGYFGARYYDSGLSIWLSVDPMSDKYPSMSPYNYCANNPVMLVDPDGRYFVGIFGQKVRVRQNEDGTIKVGVFATKALKSYVKLLNSTNSQTAKNEFIEIAKNKTRVHFKMVDEVVDNGLYGSHEPHDKNGPIPWKENSGSTGVFERMPDYIKDENGDLAYKEATITLFIGNMKEMGYEGDKLNEFQVAVGTHECFHDADTKTIDAIKERMDGKKNNFDVEIPAEKIELKVMDEIK
jgi:RHS repeat-associated protein